MIWTKRAERAAGLRAEVQTTRPARLPSVQRLANLEPDLSAVLRMTDATEMLQHSIYSITDRLHGYCLDDNARAFILINHMPGMAEGERDRLTLLSASFVHNACNVERDRFRNFMHFDWTWDEEEGSGEGL